MPFSPACSGELLNKKPPEAHADGLINKSNSYDYGDKKQTSTAKNDRRKKTATITATERNYSKHLKSEIMKTTEVKNAPVINKANTNTAPVAGNNESKPQMINNLPVSTAFNDPKDDQKKDEAEPQPTAVPEPAKAEQQVQAEPTKKELKEAFKAKVFSLEETVKLISGLGKRIAQRDKLKNTIDNLDNFVIAQSDDEDVTGSNKFQRCELSITDDNGNEFVTKNPFIIDQVAQFVNSLCVEKLAEIEASIIIPA